MNIIDLDSKESLNNEIKEQNLSTLNCIQYNDIETFKSLIKEKGIRKEQDSLDWTYLHYAAFHNNTEIAKELLNEGVDINSLTIFNETPLFIATINTNVEMVDFLIKNNADLHLENKYNIAPLKLAKIQYTFTKHDELKPKIAEIINKLETAININKEREIQLNNINEKSR
ncbi:ankyrin repeat domain-containing protein [bacterium]|nr:ankyrin repeat domain-containing protein [bacterium]